MIEMKYSPTTEEHFVALYSHPLLDRIPTRGILKAEHDEYVKRTGRAYTDPYVLGRIPMGVMDGVVPKRSLNLS